MTKINDDLLVLGTQVQIDRSGVGHCWANVDSFDLTDAVRQEIECEIIDGGKDDCDLYVASNGLHYRW